MFPIPYYINMEIMGVYTPPTNPSNQWKVIVGKVGASLI